MTNDELKEHFDAYLSKVEKESAENITRAEAMVEQAMIKNKDIALAAIILFTLGFVARMIIERYL